MLRNLLEAARTSRTAMSIMVDRLELRSRVGILYDLRRTFALVLIRIMILHDERGFYWVCCHSEMSEHGVTVWTWISNDGLSRGLWTRVDYTYSLVVINVRTLFRVL